MQPDLFVTCDYDNNIDDKDRYLGTPALVIEILSQNTRKKDMVNKLNTYMLPGVKEYWIVDIKNTQIMLYYFSENEIEQVKIFEKNEILTSYYFKELKIEIDNLFDNLIGK